MWTQRQGSVARSAADQKSLKFCHRLGKVEWEASRRSEGSGLIEGFSPGILYDSWWVDEPQGAAEGPPNAKGDVRVVPSHSVLTCILKAQDIQGRPLFNDHFWLKFINEGWVIQFLLLVLLSATLWEMKINWLVYKSNSDFTLRKYLHVCLFNRLVWIRDGMSCQVMGQAHL